MKACFRLCCRHYLYEQPCTLSLTCLGSSTMASNPWWYFGSHVPASPTVINLLCVTALTAFKRIKILSRYDRLLGQQSLCGKVLTCLDSSYLYQTCQSSSSRLMQAVKLVKSEKKSLILFRLDVS